MTREMSLVLAALLVPLGAGAQSLIVDEKLELTVTRIERLLQWEQPLPNPPMAAHPGKEFVRLSLAAKWLGGATGDPCSTRAGEYELVDRAGGKVLGMTVQYNFVSGATGCQNFTVLFQQSPQGAALATLRFKGVETSLANVPEAAATPK